MTRVRHTIVTEAGQAPAMISRRSVALYGALGVTMLALGCGKKDSSDASGTATVSAAAKANEGAVTINGAGATFPFPLYSKWVSEFNKLDPNVKINYQSVGSGAGIRQLTEKTIDFGASDAPMTDEQLAKAPAKVVHIPMTLGAVVITHNVVEASSLKLTPELLVGIFQGDIKRWDDAKLKEANPGLKLPSQNITVVYRSDGSGTTAVFTDYLAKVNPGWKEKVGAGTSVKFPVGLGAKGNEGVTGQIKTIPGALGYIELAYAKQAKLPVVALKNQAGQFVDPTLSSITAAADAFAGAIPDDLRMSIANAEAPGAYPIASFSYILVYEDMAARAKGEKLAKFLWWATHDGQKMGEPLHYAPLPASVVTRAEGKLKSLRAMGAPALNSP